MNTKRLRATFLSILSCFILVLSISTSPIWAQDNEHPCDANVGADDSIASAIAAAESGDLICLGTAIWNENLVIDKSLALRGEGSENSVVAGSSSFEGVVSIITDDEIEVSITGIAVRGIDLDGLGITIAGRANVNLASVRVESHATGIYVGDDAVLALSSSSIENNTEVSGNEEDVTAIGLRAEGRAIVDIVDSSFINNGEFGIVVLEEGSVTVVNSAVLENRIGVGALGQGNLIIENSRISENLEQGIGLLGTSTSLIHDSLLENNGTSPICLLPGNEGGEICNGLALREASIVTVRDTSINGSADWGIAASIRECGYRMDQYSGQITFEGNNSISGNNASSDHDSQGNPGAHPYGMLPDGQVCLP